MTALAAMVSIAAILQGFTLDATGSGSVQLHASPDSVRAMLLRVQTLAQHMPGVTGIVPRADGGYDYRTAREIPFSGEMRTEFIVRCAIDGAGNVSYRSPDSTAANWMQFRFTFMPGSDGTTTVHMTLRVRLVRESGTEIHLLAPVLGEEFLSERMENDITAMLETFGERLEHRCAEGGAGGTTHAQ